MSRQPLNRPLATRCAGIAAIAWLLSAVSAQGGLQATTAPQAGKPFAQPWEVSFAHIQSAMQARFATLSVDQLRRQREEVPGNQGGPATVTYNGTLEHLLFRGADSGSPARFKLEFRGIEGRALALAEFSREAAKFRSRAGFHFRYQGFRVASPVRAAQVYDLLFLGYGKRSLKQGVVNTYRMAVLPKSWDRAAWILELDSRSGYPLYSGEYRLRSSQSVVLVSELIVTGFQSGVRVPDAGDSSWWKPAMGVEVVATTSAALNKALPLVSRHVEPGVADLPVGFTISHSEVHTDPYKGQRKALLVYTDGLDHLFVQQRQVKVTPREADDSIAFLTREGMTQCLFRHSGVEFFLVGRSCGDAVRKSSARIFGRAIQTLR